MNDLRSAVRSLRATPLVTSVAVLSLTLGIGASIVIFSLTNSLLLRKLPVRDPNALVLVTDATVPSVRAYAFGVWESFRRFVDVFDGTLAWSSTDFAPGIKKAACPTLSRPAATPSSSPCAGSIHRVAVPARKILVVAR